jgi:hypothetical protein
LRRNLAARVIDGGIGGSDSAAQQGGGADEESGFHCDQTIMRNRSMTNISAARFNTAATN